MENYYKLLSINNSATTEEIRRAFRILARRYHPDVNPGFPGDKFRQIAEAYEILADKKKRAAYDSELAEAEKKQFSQSIRTLRFHEATQKLKEQRVDSRNAKHMTSGEFKKNKGSIFSQYSIKQLISKLLKIKLPSFKNILHHKEILKKISVIEVSISVIDAVQGVKKTIEISEPESVRKISVTLPPGVRTGSVIRLKSKTTDSEEIVLIVRVARHPFIHVELKGIVVEVPVTVQEAVLGSSITVPTLEDSAIIKIPPGSQSGMEIRARGKGVVLKDGSRGDIFYRLLIKVPESNYAIGIGEKVAALSEYYSIPVRHNLPASILSK